MTTSLPALEYKTAGVADPTRGLVPVTVNFGRTNPLGIQVKAATDPKFDLSGEPDGTVWAVVAVTGVKDDVNDIIVPGAFSRSLREREMKGVLGHDWNRPVAVQREAMELLPGDPRLPDTLADGATPWPREAGALLVKAAYILGTTDGRDAWEHAKAFEKTHAYSIGYKVQKARERSGVRHIYDLDVYEFSPVLHGANRLATLQAVKSVTPADIETSGQWLELPEVKARNLVRRVHDSSYWGRPVGTIIAPGMKPVGPRARAGARDRGGAQRGVGGGMGHAGLGGIRRDTAAAVRARAARAGARDDVDYRRADKVGTQARAAAARGDRETLRRLVDQHGRRTVEYGTMYGDPTTRDQVNAHLNAIEDDRDNELGVQRREGESRTAARARTASTGDTDTARAGLNKLIDAERAKRYEGDHRKIQNWTIFTDEDRPLVASEDGRVAAMHRGEDDKGNDRGWAVIDTQTGRILAKSESDDDVHEFVEAAAEAAQEQEDRDGRAGGDGREALAGSDAAGVRGDSAGQAGGVLPRPGDAGAGADHGAGGRAGGAGQSERDVPGSGGSAGRGGSGGAGAGDSGDDLARPGTGDTGRGRSDDAGVPRRGGGVLPGAGRGADGVDADYDPEQDSGVQHGPRGDVGGPHDPDVHQPEPELQQSTRLDDITGDNFAPTGIDDLAPAGVRAKLDANLLALHTLRRLQHNEPQRPATAEEQAALARWAGWGGLPKVFDESDPTYADERRELRGLMSDREWNEARRNTLNAHYTDARAVSAVWDAVKALDGGQTGDRILEPGSGSGNFIGFAPDGVDMVGVELDSTTAGISKYLYPNATIRNESFADTRVPEGAFDGVIGNVPFGRFELFDPVHNPDGESIHNHFINKSLALTRPGGVVAVLTSRYTMDSADSKARERMASMGDLIGAVRLPNGSHRRASGTDVIEDVLIFRKRAPGEEPHTDQSWVQSGRLAASEATGKRGDYVTLNPYWQQNPTHVLGRTEVVRGQYGADIRVRGDDDQVNLRTLPPVLGEIVETAREQGVTGTRRDPDDERPALLAPDSSRVEGHVQAEPDGTFSQAVGGAAVRIDVPKAQAKELAGLFGIRDALQELLRLESHSTEDTPEITAARVKLNADYDAYVRTFGPVNRYELNAKGGRKPRPVASLFRRDPTSALVRALETYDPAGNDGKGSATKAAIFTKRAAAPREIATTADNPADAVALSMDTYGEINLPEIARMLGTDEATARAKLGDLVHEVPPLSFEEEEAAWDAERALRASGGTDLPSPDDEPEALRAVRTAVTGARGELVPRGEYLSGGVRRKLAIAKVAARHDPRFTANVAALEKVIPRELGADEIDARLGAVWVPASDVQDFANELMQTSGYGRDKVTVSTIKGVWRVEGGTTGANATNTWGTEDRPFGKLLQGILEQRPIKIKIKDDEQGSMDATLSAQAKAEELQERFREWLWENPDRARRLVAGYNDQFNGIALRDYSGSTRTFPGMAVKFKPRPHQVAAVERIVNEPTALLGHVVGAGKTAEMVLGAAELKRLGLARKPAIVVPNHMLEQFTREYLEIYPQAKVLAAGTEDLQGDKRREFVARAATGDWDVVILTQEAMKAVPMSYDQQKAYVEQQTSEMRAALEEAKAAGATADDKTVKEMEKQIQAAETALQKLLKKSGDDKSGVTFEQTGIDYLFVDEAHHYSNLRTVSRIQNSGATGSGKATDLHMKLEYLRSTTNSGRVATFATGTPIRNTVTQAYIMMRFLRPDLLREANIDTFDQWAATFGEVVEEMELKPEGSGFRQTSRFAKFRNVPELLRIFHTFADIKLAEDLKLPTPNLTGGRAETVAVAPSGELREYIKALGDRAEEVRSGRVDPEDDNMLKISTDGRKAALSMALVGQEHREGKIEAAADKIGTIWSETKDRVYPVNPDDPDAGDDPQRGGLQIVFLDLGTPQSGKPAAKTTAAEEDDAVEGGDPADLADAPRYDAYAKLREELVARGMDVSRIRFMHEARNDAEKAELFAAARSGRIDVLIGSTEKMGVGTNVQRRAIALHHLDAPWRPADVEQRDGRIMRQGNLNPDIRILRYVTEGSFDAYMWQTLERKAKFINQIMKGSLDVREIEDVGDTAMSYAEVKALATGNMDLLAKAKVDALKVKLERLSRTHGRTQTNLRNDVGKYTVAADQAEADAEKIEGVLPRRVDTRGDRFRAEIDGQTYTDRQQAAEALRATLDPLFGELRRAWNPADRRRKVGTLGGLDVYAQYADTTTGPQLELSFDGVPGIFARGTRNDLLGNTSTGYILRAENYLGGLDGQRAALLDRADSLREEVSRMQPRIGLAFARERELEAARAKSARLQAKMQRDAARAASPSLGPDWTRADLDEKLPPPDDSGQDVFERLRWDPAIDTDVNDDPILGRDEESVTAADLPTETTPEPVTTEAAPVAERLGRDVVSPPGEVADDAPEGPATAGLDAATLDAARADADAALADGDHAALAGALGRMGVPREDGRDELASALVALPDDVRRRRLDQIEEVNAGDEHQPTVLANQRRRVIEEPPADVQPAAEEESDAGAAVPQFATRNDVADYIATAGPANRSTISAAIRGVGANPGAKPDDQQRRMIYAALAGRGARVNDYDPVAARAALVRLADNDPTLPANSVGQRIVFDGDRTGTVTAVESATRNQVRLRITLDEPGPLRHNTRGNDFLRDRGPETERLHVVDADAVLTPVDPGPPSLATIAAERLTEAREATDLPEEVSGGGEEGMPRLGLTDRDAYGKPWQQGYESAWMRLRERASGRGINTELAFADYSDADLAEALNLTSRGRAQIRYSAGGSGQGEKRAFDRLEANIRAEQQRRREQRETTGAPTADANRVEVDTPAPQAPTPTADGTPRPAASGAIAPAADELSEGTMRALGLRPGDRVAMELRDTDERWRVLTGRLSGTEGYVKLDTDDGRTIPVGGAATVVHAAKLDETGRVIASDGDDGHPAGANPTPESSRARTNRLNRAAENAGGQGGSASRRVLNGSVHYVAAPDTPEDIGRVQTAIRDLGWGGVGMSLGVSRANREDRGGPGWRSIEVRVPDMGSDGRPLRVFEDEGNTYVADAQAAEEARGVHRGMDGRVVPPPDSELPADLRADLAAGRPVTPEAEAPVEPGSGPLGDVAEVADVAEEMRARIRTLDTLMRRGAGQDDPQARRLRDEILALRREQVRREEEQSAQDRAAAAAEEFDPDAVPEEGQPEPVDEDQLGMFGGAGESATIPAADLAEAATLDWNPAVEDAPDTSPEVQFRNRVDDALSGNDDTELAAIFRETGSADPAGDADRLYDVPREQRADTLMARWRAAQGGGESAPAQGDVTPDEVVGAHAGGAVTGNQYAAEAYQAFHFDQNGPAALAAIDKAEQVDPDQADRWARLRQEYGAAPVTSAPESAAPTPAPEPTPTPAPAPAAPAPAAPAPAPAAGAEPIELALDGPMLAPDQLNIADAPGIIVSGRTGTVTDPDSLRDWLEERSNESARGGAAVKRRRAAARLLRALDDHLADREDDQGGSDEETTTGGANAGGDAGAGAGADTEEEGGAGAGAGTGGDAGTDGSEGEGEEATDENLFSADAAEARPSAADQDGAPEPIDGGDQGPADQGPADQAPEGEGAPTDETAGPSLADQPDTGVLADDVTENDNLTAGDAVEPGPADIAPGEEPIPGPDGLAPDAAAPDGTMPTAADQPGAPDAGVPAAEPEQTVLPAELIEEANAVEADALGLIEADDGELEVTEDVAQRQSRVERRLRERQSGKLNIAKLKDSELGDGRRDTVDELRLQEAIARRERERRREARQQRQAAQAAQAAAMAAPTVGPDGAPLSPEDGDTGGIDGLGGAGAVPPTPAPAPAPTPRRRPGLAGAVEDWADAVESGDTEAAAAGMRRVQSSLRRSRADSQQHRDLAAMLEELQAPGATPDVEKLRSLAGALRENARASRNEAAKRRRVAKRIERERLRSLLGEYDTELRHRGRDPLDYGGAAPEPVDIGPEDGGPGATPDAAGADGTGPGSEAEGSEGQPETPAPVLPTFDRSDPDGPTGQARTTGLVDGLVSQPWRLLGAGVVTNPDDPGQARRVAAARKAIAPVLDEFGPFARRRTNEDHDQAARQARANLRRQKGGGNVDAAAGTFALLLPAGQRPAFVAAMRTAIAAFKKEVGGRGAGQGPR